MSYTGAFKNYRSQLNGWALGQAIAMGIKDPIVAQETATQFVNYAYVVEKDLEDLTARLAELIKASVDPLAEVDYILQELNFAKEQIEAQQPKVQPIGKAN